MHWVESTVLILISYNADYNLQNRSSANSCFMLLSLISSENCSPLSTLSPWISLHNSNCLLFWFYSFMSKEHIKARHWESKTIPCFSFSFLHISGISSGPFILTQQMHSLFTPLLPLCFDLILSEEESRTSKSVMESLCTSVPVCFFLLGKESVGRYILFSGNSHTFWKASLTLFLSNLTCIKRSTFKREIAPWSYLSEMENTIMNCEICYLLEKHAS